MGHNHNHKGDKNLKVAFFLNVTFTILELVGGFFVNSVAIISDAVHDLGDSLSLGTAWYLQRKSYQKPDSKFSYGYHRFSLLGALISGVVLIIGSIFVVQEAIARIIQPEEANAEGMMYFAIAGVLVNGIAALRLRSGTSLNERVVAWHLLEDVLGWVAVLVVSIILQFKDYPILDPILSLAITGYIMFGVIQRLRETLVVFLQGVPMDVNLNQLKDQIRAIDSVHSIHETHIWSLEGDHHVFSTHIRLKEIDTQEDVQKVKKSVLKLLEPFDFHHVTIETELVGEYCEFEREDH